MSRPSALLLMGGKVASHNTPGHYEFLPGLLGGPAGLNVHVVDELAPLTQLPLGDYDLIVNYHSDSGAAAEHIDALWAAVRSGTPLLGLHAAPYTVKDLPGGKEAIGTFYEGPHLTFQSFVVQIADLEHPITAGLKDFTIEDEEYRLRRVEGSEIHVLGTYDDRTLNRRVGDQEFDAEGIWPIIYNKQLGRGKIHVNALGHNLHAFTNPSYRRLIVQAVDWLLKS